MRYNCKKIGILYIIFKEAYSLQNFSFYMTSDVGTKLFYSITFSQKPRKSLHFSLYMNTSYEHLPKRFAKIDLSCDCTTKQRDWLINDGDLVLPEYIVDFEYVTKV